MPDKQPEFDAHLVGVWDRELDYGQRNPAMFYMKKPAIRLNSAIYGQIGSIDRTTKLASDLGQAAVARGVVERTNQLMEREGISPEVSEILRNGRIRIDLLMNTPGGRTLMASRLQYFLDGRKERGGVLNTYGGNVASAGAFAWQTVDRRYVLDKSELLWHTGALAPGPKLTGKFVDELREMEKAESFDDIRGFFKTANEKYRARLLQALEEDVDSRHEVIIGGETLANIGLAHKSFGAAADMRAFFDESCGWATKRYSRVRRFWQTLSELE